MKQNKSLAAALDVAKIKKHAERYGMSAERFNEVAKAISIPEKPSKLATGHLTPAYGRLCITSAHVLDWFNRGFDFENNDPHVPGRYCSIRDFQQGAQIQFRYGKRLQKTFIYIIPGSTVA